MSFLFLFAVAYGICFGLMNRKLPGFSEWLIARQWRVEGEGEDKTTFFGRMLVCPYCTGFHAGWIAWLLVRLAGHADHSFSWERIAYAGAEWLAAAFASAAVCYLADTAAQWAEDTNNAIRSAADKYTNR
jgi:hypothetical protein